MADNNDKDNNKTSSGGTHGFIYNAIKDTYNGFRNGLSTGNTDQSGYGPIIEANGEAIKPKITGPGLSNHDGRSLLYDNLYPDNNTSLANLNLAAIPWHNEKPTFRSEIYGTYSMEHLLHGVGLTYNRLLSRILNLQTFNKNKLFNPIDYVNFGRTYVFFTRPDLFLFVSKHKGQDLKNPIINPSIQKNCPDLFVKIMKNLSVATQLQSIYSMMPVTIQDKGFVNLLGNMCTDIAYPEMILSTKNAAKNVKGYGLSYGGDFLENMKSTELTFSFYDNRYRDVSTMIEIWTEYIEGVSQGRIYPKLMYRDMNVIDYAVSIYIFVVDETNNILSHGALVGCYPKTSNTQILKHSRSPLDVDSFLGPFPFTWQVSHVMKPNTHSAIEMFNYASGWTSVSTRSPKGQPVEFVLKGASRGNGEKTKTLKNNFQFVDSYEAVMHGGNTNANYGTKDKAESVKQIDSINGKGKSEYIMHSGVQAWGSDLHKSLVIKRNKKGHAKYVATELTITNYWPQFAGVVMSQSTSGTLNYKLTFFSLKSHLVHDGLSAPIDYSAVLDVDHYKRELPIMKPGKDGGPSVLEEKKVNIIATMMAHWRKRILNRISPRMAGLESGKYISKTRLFTSGNYNSQINMTTQEINAKAQETTESNSGDKGDAVTNLIDRIHPDKGFAGKVDDWIKSHPDIYNQYADKDKDGKISPEEEKAAKEEYYKQQESAYLRLRDDAVDIINGLGRYGNLTNEEEKLLKYAQEFLNSAVGSKYSDTVAKELLAKIYGSGKENITPTTVPNESERYYPSGSPVARDWKRNKAGEYVYAVKQGDKVINPLGIDGVIHTITKDRVFIWDPKNKRLHKLIGFKPDASLKVGQTISANGSLGTVTADSTNFRYGVGIVVSKYKGKGKNKDIYTVDKKYDKVSRYDPNGTIVPTVVVNKDKDTNTTTTPGTTNNNTTNTTSNYKLNTKNNANGTGKDAHGRKDTMYFHLDSEKGKDVTAVEGGTVIANKDGLIMVQRADGKHFDTYKNITSGLKLGSVITPGSILGKANGDTLLYGYAELKKNSSGKYKYFYADPYDPKNSSLMPGYNSSSNTTTEQPKPNTGTGDTTPTPTPAPKPDNTADLVANPDRVDPNAVTTAEHDANLAAPDGAATAQQDAANAAKVNGTPSGDKPDTNGTGEEPVEDDSNNGKTGDTFDDSEVTGADTEDQNLDDDPYPEH